MRCSMESSTSNSKERELQLTQRLAKQRHSHCLTWVEQLETHLYDLYLLNSPYAVDAFKHQHSLISLVKEHQLSLKITQFKEFLASKGVNATDLLNQGWQQDFEYFTRCKPSAYRRELLENLDTLEAVIHKVVNTYGVLRMKENEVNALKENGSQLHDEILHEHKLKQLLIEPEKQRCIQQNHRVKLICKRQEEKGPNDAEGSLMCWLVSTESRWAPIPTSRIQVAVQGVIPHKPWDQISTHTEQSEPSYDTHLLETIDRNTTPTSTNMCHKGREIDQDALLNAELLKMKDMVDKENLQ
ncbi:hypothetical protein Tco_1301043 [Tanacetum coccineum]